MMELSVAVAAGMMVAAVLAKGYTAKQLTQLRQEAGHLVHEESRTRKDLEQAQVLEESAEALHNQASYDCEKFEKELSELESDIAKVEKELGSVSSPEDG